MKRRSEQGVALVITLILLSVITFMAVTFLVLSNRGREQVTALTDQKIAREANEEAVQVVMGQIVAKMLATTNGFNIDAFVSTNYVSAAFNPTPPNPSGRTAITNVNYFYPNGAALQGVRDLIPALNNLLLLPRAPVFVTTNRNFPPEFRYWLDLNRNGKFETNGFTPDLDNFGQAILNPSNGLPLLTTKLGDPEWIGILDHPDQRHSPSNKFVARIAFFVQPIGNSLDWNYIHSQSRQSGNPNQDGYFRNQGVNSFEINLAGFLNALNVNEWTYQYDTNTVASAGTAFSDAVAILRYRYAGTPNNLKRFQLLYGNAAARAFSRDGMDGYGIGPLQTTLAPLPLNASGFDNDLNAVGSRPWSGANNSNFLFSLDEMFNFPDYGVANGFAARLAHASTNKSSYDAYTFYRMMSQIGVGSTTDSGNKLNLNYSTANGTNATNFAPWSPVQFFTAAADRLLQANPDMAGLGLDSGRIPIYPTNQYTPAVHRLLQVAANIYDASTWKGTNVAPSDFDYPSVFRPVFGLHRNGTEIRIDGYVEVGTNADYLVPPLSLADDIDKIKASIGGTNVVNIYGVPWIIGARKGFPNFNEVSMQSFVDFSRKVQINKGTPASARSSWQTNIQYNLGISNLLAMETWNSYAANYARPITLLAADSMKMAITNELGVLTPPGIFTNLYTNGGQFAANQWRGFNSQFPHANVNSNSFVVPLKAMAPLLSNGVYQTGGFFDSNATFKTTAPDYPQPNFGFNVTNRMWMVLVDTPSGRVIDYVTFDNMNSRRRLLDELPGTDNGGPGGVWVTNRLNFSQATTTPLEGVQNQIDVSLGYTNLGSHLTVDDVDWANANLKQGGFNSKQDAIARFTAFYSDPISDTVNSAMQVPYTPTRKTSVYYTWQANDPLVHYTLPDLTGLGDLSTAPQTNYTRTVYTNVLANIRTLNTRYRPWNPSTSPSSGYPDYDAKIELKDPRIFNSDSWQFPTNKYPTIGWLGRVHRGTPWQTIYLKSQQVDTNRWVNWTGNNTVVAVDTNRDHDYGDWTVTLPTNDWEFVDLFTTAPNDNARRGTLSINQTNLAAWASIFYGVVALSGSPPNYTPVVIDPTGTPTVLTNLVQAINSKRNDYPENVFTRLGDILATPELTMKSPFLDTSNPLNLPDDAAYEWLPQQVLSLLRVGSPRYVIYAYAQTLRPAKDSQFTGGGGVNPALFGMVTNYQVTAEYATRTVIRLDAVGGNPSPRFRAFNPTGNPVMLDVSRRGDPAPAPPTPRAVIESFTILPPN